MYLFFGGAVCVGASQCIILFPCTTPNQACLENNLAFRVRLKQDQADKADSQLLSVEQLVRVVV